MSVGAARRIAATVSHPFVTPLLQAAGEWREDGMLGKQLAKIFFTGLRRHAASSHG
jgi:hypothetical protein